MDTRFWGPSGWKLLHSIAINYGLKNAITNKERDNFGIFFSTLEYVLPCKYCRMSLTQYVDELPIEDHLSTNESFNFWLYSIHNKVNKKLRDQGLLHDKDPPFRDIMKKYKTLTKKHQCDICDLSSWDFLYSICFNLPPRNSIDMERKKNYILFFNYLAKVLPSTHNRNNFQEYLDKHPIENNIDSRKKLTKWFYNFNCYKNKTELNYNSVCHKYEKIRSKCEKKGAKVKGVKTCRKNTIKAPIKISGS
jgi:hypothetical protein